jgi:trehalose-6-phosphatase
VVQNEIINSNNKSNKIVGLIVHQNIVAPEELKTIMRVNCLDINNNKNVLKKIIKLNQEEKVKILNEDCNQIKKSSTTMWIKDCLCELKKIMISNKNTIRQKIGFGLDFYYYQTSKYSKPLSQKYIPNSFRSKSTKLFLFDFNSIFTCVNNSYTEDKDQEDDINNNLNIDNNNNNNNINNISNSFIDNNKKIINLLSSLSFDENNIIYLITNKSKDVFKEINLNPINFGYVAEGGYIIKPIGEEKFQNTLSVNNDNNDWKSTLIQLFNNFSKKVGIGSISQKEYSVTWNFQNNENINGNMLIKELIFLVENYIDKGKYDIIIDNNSLEVKIKNNSKYHYITEIIQKIVNEKKNFNFIFGLNNNDKYGEGFFDYLFNFEKDFKDNNINLYTAVIGKKTTKANYYFKDISCFIDVFKVFDIQN